MMNFDISDTADVETSSDEYARRFSGKTGEWFLKVQSDIILEMLRKTGCKTVIDVGGGHGQLVVPLSKAGFEITILGSTEQCSHRIKNLIDSGRCQFTAGSVVTLPYSEESFDAAISTRLMAHCTDWKKLVFELCRVAKTSVIIDYPPLRGFNALAPSLFGLKKRIEGNTRKYRAFKSKEIREEFNGNGFEVTESIGEFFLPMVFHRAIRCSHISKLLEYCFRRIKLTRHYGSPVILHAIRKK